MRGVSSNANDVISVFIPPHEPPFQASSSPIIPYLTQRSALNLGPDKKAVFFCQNRNFKIY